MISCLWFGLCPNCQVHITDHVGNNSISIMLNTVTSTGATQTVVTFYSLSPCTQKLLRHLEELPNWIMIMLHENPSLIPLYHRYLICTVTVWRPTHLAFELGKPPQRPDPSESDSRCAEGGREARHRLVILLAKWGPPAGRLPLPLPPAPSSVPPLSSADRPPSPGTEKPSGVCLGQFTGRMKCICVCQQWCLHECLCQCVCGVCVINVSKLAFAGRSHKLR